MVRWRMGSWRFRALTLLAAGLALAARARADDAEDKAVAAVQKRGGRVERDEKADGKPVIVAYFGTLDVNDDALQAVKDLAKLKKLTLNGTKITDAGLDHIKDLKALEKLYLVDTKITDAALEKLKGLAELRVLSLVGTQVSDAGLEHLKGLANLQELFVAGTKVSDDGVKKIKEALPKLKVEK